MSSLDKLKIKIFADGADINTIRELAKNPLIKGFTTNPSLLRKAGVTDYVSFAKEAIEIVAPRPISFEVFADDLQAMEEQARVISSWGENVYVKIPITNTQGDLTASVIRNLSGSGVKINITAVFTEIQLDVAEASLQEKTPSIISIFAGRIADTGRNPEIWEFEKLEDDNHIDILWASPREIYDIWRAENCGYNIITITPEILAKLPLIDKDLTEYSLETVKMFANDAKASGLSVYPVGSYGSGGFG